jgi:uncharacterized Zn finger protein (UPF0148 family)
VQSAYLWRNVPKGVRLMNTHCAICGKPLFYHLNERGKTIKRVHGRCKKKLRNLKKIQAHAKRYDMPPEKLQELIQRELKK